MARQLAALPCHTRHGFPTYDCCCVIDCSPAALAKLFDFTPSLHKVGNQVLKQDSVPRSGGSPREERHDEKEYFKVFEYFRGPIP